MWFAGLDSWNCFGRTQGHFSGGDTGREVTCVQCPCREVGVGLAPPAGESLGLSGGTSRLLLVSALAVWALGFQRSREKAEAPNGHRSLRGLEASARPLPLPVAACGATLFATVCGEAGARLWPLSATRLALGVQGLPPQTPWGRGKASQLPTCLSACVVWGQRQRHVQSLCWPWKMAPGETEQLTFMSRNSGHQQPLTTTVLHAVGRG